MFNLEISLTIFYYSVFLRSNHFSKRIRIVQILDNKSILFESETRESTLTGLAYKQIFNRLVYNYGSIRRSGVSWCLFQSSLVDNLFFVRIVGGSAKERRSIPRTLPWSWSWSHDDVLLRSRILFRIFAMVSDSSHLLVIRRDPRWTLNSSSVKFCKVLSSDFQCQMRADYFTPPSRQQT